jgi:hypothetical protein
LLLPFGRWTKAVLDAWTMCSYSEQVESNIACDRRTRPWRIAANFAKLLELLAADKQQRFSAADDRQGDILTVVEIGPDEDGDPDDRSLAALEEP